MLKYKKKQIVGLLLVVIGVGILSLSYYIHTQVKDGKMQVGSGQKKVDSVNRVFSVAPASKPVGNMLTGSAQTQINEGKGKIAQYEQFAYLLQIGGGIAIILGVGLWLFGLFKKN